jgi:phospholipase D1/2
MSEREDPLAYGHHYGYGDSQRDGEGDSARGFIKDTFHTLRSNFQSQQPQGSYQDQPSSQTPQQSYQSGGYSVRLALLPMVHLSNA